MTEEQWESYINDLIDRQIKAVRAQGVIFTMSLSYSQVRIFIEPIGQRCREYFLYRQATEEVASKVVKKVDEYLTSIKN